MEKTSKFSIRDKDIKKLTDKIIMADHSFGYTININAPWGYGKTFFAERMKLKLDGSKFIALNINLTDYEYCSDPIIPFIIVILDYIENIKDASIKQLFIDKIIPVVEGALGLISIIDPTGVSDGLCKIIDLFKKKNEQCIGDAIAENLKTIISYNSYLKRIVEGINDVSNSLGKSFLVIVDDFDRTLPDYAYRFLNVIHQFKTIKNEINNNLIFCLLMNRPQFEFQLQHRFGPTISNDESYLTKFIDFEHILTHPIKDGNNPWEFIKSELSFNQMPNYDASIAKALGMISIRELKTFLSLQPYCKEAMGDLPDRSNVIALVGMAIIYFAKFKLEIQSAYFGLMNNEQLINLTILMKKSNLTTYFNENKPIELKFCDYFYGENLFIPEKFNLYKNKHTNKATHHNDVNIIIGALEIYHEVMKQYLKLKQ